MPGYDMYFENSRGEFCQQCHLLAGSGTSIPRIPDLTNEARRNRGVTWQIAHLKDPTNKVRGSGMPPMAPVYNDQELTDLARFLETLGTPERAEDPAYMPQKAGKQ